MAAVKEEDGKITCVKCGTEVKIDNPDIITCPECKTQYRSGEFLGWPFA